MKLYRIILAIIFGAIAIASYLITIAIYFIYACYQSAYGVRYKDTERKVSFESGEPFGKAGNS